MKKITQSLRGKATTKPIAFAIANYPKTTLTVLAILLLTIYLFIKSITDVYILNLESLYHFTGLNLTIVDSIGLLDLIITTYNGSNTDQIDTQRYLLIGLKKFTHYNLYSYIVFSFLSLCFCTSIGIVICIKVIVSEILLEKVIHFIVKDYNNGLPKCIEISQFIMNLFA